MSETTFTGRSGKNARLFGVKDTSTGKMYFTAVPGNNSYEMSFPFDCDFEGIEIYAHDANIGDHLTRIETKYSIDAGATWLRYRKFGKEWSVFPNTLTRIILFPTEPKAGVKLHFEYFNEGTVNVKFCMNLFIMSEDEKIDVTQGQEGEDW